MEQICKDIILEIFAQLSFRDFIAASLSTRQLAIAAGDYAANHNLCAKGYGKYFGDTCTLILQQSLQQSLPQSLQRALITAYTYPCGRSAWDVAAGCKCWVECGICTRRLPFQLTIKHYEARYCTYPCIMRCAICNHPVTAENVAEFRFCRQSGNIMQCSICHQSARSFKPWADTKEKMSGCYLEGIKIETAEI